MQCKHMDRNQTPLLISQIARWQVTDKNLQALAFSSAGAVLCKDSARLEGCVFILAASLLPHACVPKKRASLAYSCTTTIQSRNSSKRSILAMIDPPCEACGGRDRRHLLKACDVCDLSFHLPCLPQDARPTRDAQHKWWTCIK